jgi:hypothetical protein
MSDLSQYAIANPEQHMAQSAAVEEKPKYTKRKDDTRFWKPNVNNPAKAYQSLNRALPRAIGSNLAFSVRQDTHRLYDEASGAYLVTKCPKSLGDNEQCCVCDANWAMYKQGKASNNKALQDIAYERRNQTSYIGNFYIVNDLVRPEFNGQVKLWEHTARMHKKLDEPMTTGTQLVAPVGFGAQPVLEKFIPYDIVNGHNFGVHMTVNPDNNIPTYDTSAWEPQAAPLAPTGPEIEAIMAQVYDLTEFTADIPTSEEIAVKYQDWLNKVAAGGNANAQIPTGNGPVTGNLSQQPQGAASQAVSVAGFGSQTAQPAQANVTQGASVFAQPSPDLSKYATPAPQAAPAQAAPTQVAPQAQATPTIHPDMVGSSDDSEDDLPF